MVNVSWLSWFLKILKAKILFPENHAKILHICTNLDIFMGSTISSSWQDLPRFSMFLIKVVKFQFTGYILTRQIFSIISTSDYAPPKKLMSKLSFTKKVLNTTSTKRDGTTCADYYFLRQKSNEITLNANQNEFKKNIKFNQKF